MTRFLKPRLARFSRDTDGYITVEAIIVFPVMLWLFGAAWVYFDAFRQQSVSQKANYVIADMISRETQVIDTAYVTNAYRLLRMLTQSTNEDTDLRVAVLEFNEDIDGWTVAWSRQRGGTMGGGGNRLTDADMPGYADRLPGGVDGEQLIIVETWDDYEPAFDVGLGSFEIRSYSFTSPRYAPQIVFSNS